jgi:hypothetical protein
MVVGPLRVVAWILLQHHRFVNAGVYQLSEVRVK